MGRLVVVVLLAICAYTGWQKLKPAKPLEALYERPYVVVYGRDACGLTANMRKSLERAGIPFYYEVIDQREVAEVVWARMRQSKIDTSSYMLPVVDVNARIYLDAEPSEIIAAYRGS